MANCYSCGKQINFIVKILGLDNQYYCGDCIEEANKSWREKQKKAKNENLIYDSTFNPQTDKDFKISTTPTIPGYKIVEFYGVVTGLSPRSRGMFGQFVGALQKILGGEITAFTTEIEKARIEAISRAVHNARAFGANALIGLDIETSDIMQTITLISATGTAVKIEPE